MLPVAIRHEGLLFGIELQQEVPELPLLALQESLLLNVTQKKTIRLLPPLILDSAHAKLIAEKIGILLAKYLKTSR